MATIRLIPSTYAVSSTYYLSVSNASNMYHNTDNTTYATITNTYSSTSSRYLYLRGFNFDDVPSAAVINSFTVKIKGYESGLATSNSYAPRLANGSSALANTTASSNFGTSVDTITIPTGALTWEQIVNYNNNFTIMVYVRRNSRNTTGYFYCYGAEIDVTYTVPDPRTITSTLSGNGTISPSGAITSYDGQEYELTITPTNKSDQVTATQDGVDITSQLVAHGAGSTISATPDDVNTSGIQSGSSYASYCIGHSAENPTSSGTTSNMYASQYSTGYAAYTFDFSSIPNNATIEELVVRCYGHRENSTIDSTHVSNVALYYGSTMRGEDVDFPSTSNSTVTIDNTGTWTRAELDSLTLRHTVGYYGGLVLGITVQITYSTGTGIDHYTYTYTVNGNSNIAVTIGSVTTYTVTATSQVSGITISPATQTIVEGANATVKLNDNYNIIVKDNNVDVTSNLVYHSGSGSSATFTGVPTSYDSANSTYDGIYSGSTSDGLTSHTDSNRICVYANTAANSVSKLTYNFDCSSIPQDAVITSVTCIASAACYSSGQYFSTRTLQLYSGSTAKGTATTITGSGGTRTEHNISGGSWTRAELDNAKIVVYIQRGSNTTQASFSFWGATLTVAYTVPDSYYEYTITNVTTDHTIIVTQSTSGNKIFRKINGSWVQSTKEYVKVSGTWRQVSKVYLKINGSWTEQSDKSAMFNPNAIYINGNV